MNVFSFKDVADGKRSALANDLEDDDDDDEDEQRETSNQTKKRSLDEEGDEDDDEEDAAILKARGRKVVEGEEEDGELKFNEAGEAIMPFNLNDDRLACAALQVERVQ